MRIVTERDTGKPRGFCFVEFYDVATAESAIRNLSGTDFHGRTIRIVYADGGPFEGRGGSGGGGFDGLRGGGPGGPGDRAQRDRVVGGDLSYHSALGVASLLGQPAAPGTAADAITVLLARKTRGEMYDYLAAVRLPTRVPVVCLCVGVCEGMGVLGGRGGLQNCSELLLPLMPKLVTLPLPVPKAAVAQLAPAPCRDRSRACCAKTHTRHASCWWAIRSCPKRCFRCRRVLG